MKRCSGTRPKRQVALYDSTHEQLSALARAARVSLAEYVERRFGKAVERDWRRLLTEKVTKQDS